MAPKPKEFVDGASLEAKSLAITVVGSIFLSVWEVWIRFFVAVRDSVTRVLDYQAGSWELFVGILFEGIPAAISQAWTDLGGLASGLGPLGFVAMVGLTFVGIYAIERLIRRLIP